MITFNVLFMPGSASQLLPFSLSLLQAPEVRIRLIANGCAADEVDLLRAATDIDERLSFYALPERDPIEHGRALNHLFDVFNDEPYFAFVDSDVIAGGDFAAGLLPVSPGTAIFSAPPIWLTEDEAVVSPRARYLGGHMGRLPEGTPVGWSFFCVYERAAIEPLLRQLPRGFAVHYRYLLPRPIRNAFSERGWRFEMFDSCRVLNLLLLLEGHRLENRVIPELHHVGSFSLRVYKGLGANLRHILERARARPSRSLWVVGGATAFRLQARWWRRGERDRLQVVRRREIVLPYVDQALAAIVARRPVPPAPRTDSAEVDGRVAAFVSALEAQYLPNLGLVQGATASRPEPVSPAG